MNATTDLCGETVLLRADRSLFWPRRQTLVVADLHFGKAATFRAASLPVPGGNAATLARLGQALDETAARRLVVLGDFWHARPGRTAAVLAELTDWRAARPELQIDLVRGNHDRAGSPPAAWAAGWLAEHHPDSPFAYAHHPAESGGGYVLAGHLHPGYRLFEGGRPVLLPCFWLRERYAVLPAFGSFTGFAAVQPTPADRLYVIADEDVIAVNM